MTIAICPKCKIKYDRDESWKKVCLSCWKKSQRSKPDYSPGTNYELLTLRAEVYALRQQLDQASQTSIEPDMLARLIRLCHPDRHGGSESSNTATAWLLGKRGES